MAAVLSARMPEKETSQKPKEETTIDQMGNSNVREWEKFDWYKADERKERKEKKNVFEK